MKKFGLTIMVLSFVLVIASGGCGQRDPHVSVSGLVTVNGEPIEEGMIQFVPVDGRTAEGGGRIQDGRFDAKVPPGEKIVRIQGTKVTGKRLAEGTSGKKTEVNIKTPVTSQKEHWDESTLRVTVKQKNDPFDFKL